jgi:hypothetical protein
MAKTIINVINSLALLVSFYWASKNGFQIEQVLAILTTLSTLITLNFESMKGSLVSQDSTIIGSKNKIKQHAKSGQSGKQRQRVEGDDNEQEQTIN